MVEVLDSTDLGKDTYFDNLNENDYDLDVSKAYEVPYNCFSNSAEYFYTAHEHPRKVWYSSRRNIWKNWYTAFKGKYNIADNEVAIAICDEKIPSNWLWKDKLSEDDYNLD